MREILFRGKRKDNGEWVEGNLNIEYDGSIFISLWKSILVEEDTNYHEPTCISYEIIPETLGQFTGRTISKNHPMYDDNIKLYEGDMFTVGSSQTIFTVVFENYEWIGISKEGDDFSPFKYRLSAIKETIHIIGNIHES